MLVSLATLESHLWESANILRGPVDAADFKTYIFPLLFFKRICDVWDEEYAEIVDETGDAELAMFPESHRFQIPDDCHWNDVRAVATNVGNLRSTGGRPDMSGATNSEQEAIERACDSAKKYSGPGAYYGCLKRELGNLRSSGGRPDMSRANYSEQAAIERACESAQKYSGPGAYYSCLRRELGRLGYR